MLGRTPILMEDGASIHGTRGGENMQRYKELQGLPTCLWPGCSSDFNPIENMWRVMKQRLRHLKKPPQTKEELKKALIKIWNKIDQSLVDKYIDSMLERMLADKAMKGLMTKY
jgi:transposase